LLSLLAGLICILLAGQMCSLSTLIPLGPVPFEFQPVVIQFPSNTALLVSYRIYWPPLVVFKTQLYSVEVLYPLYEVRVSRRISASSIIIAESLVKPFKLL